jgi:exoribonuclease R
VPALATTIEGDLAGRSLEAAFESIRAELDVRVAFPPEVLAAAERAARSAPRPERDETAVPFVTVDPPGSMDLDQAVHIERDGDGFRVRYAIADVPAFVEPGGPLDAEVLLRGQTIYCPDVRVPLHPPVLSEGAASLLPGEERPAFVWDIRLDAGGERTSAGLYRARVRSHRRYTYDEVQREVDGGTSEAVLRLLREVGELRIERESARGGASLAMPQQEVHVDGGAYRLRLRPTLAAEAWNAQVSLLAGMVAAAMMIEGRVGILRTLPPAGESDVARFRRTVRALGVEWPGGMAYGDFLRTLDRADPRHLAIVHEAASLFRGAGYTPLDGEVPADPAQAALAAPYAHVTAPLRRLVDRFALVTCEALSAGTAVPAWVREALGSLPEVMAASDRQARAVERACTDAVEAAVLEHRVGEMFDAVVVDRQERGGLVLQVTEPAVSAKATGEAELGARVRAELVEADVARRTVTFAVRDAGPTL